MCVCCVHVYIWRCGGYDSTTTLIAHATSYCFCNYGNRRLHKIWILFVSIDKVRITKELTVYSVQQSKIRVTTRDKETTAGHKENLVHDKGASTSIAIFTVVACR